jgi:hypothetical protein
MWLQAGGGKDPNVSVIIICLSFIASLAASDIRGLTRPDAAPEILMVLGSPHFVAQQIIIGFFLGALVTSPIWLIIGITHPNHPVVSLAILGQLALGSTIALLANTFFVPSQQDVTAEFLSATISTCLIIALEKVTTSLKVATTLRAESIIWITCALIVALCVFSVERRRNNYYWKEIRTHVS